MAWIFVVPPRKGYPLSTKDLDKSQIIVGDSYRCGKSVRANLFE